MSKELDELDFEQISNKAKAEADEEVGDKISSVTRLNKDEVKKLFPDTDEQQKLTELMKIVKSADDHNKKVNAITNRAEEFSGVVVKLLDKFV